ncbi:hypothetical protein L1887_37824 [Cichorium endivia]|nr:hypothetical protein L1887_37824 [Cichorium endivia]
MLVKQAVDLSCGELVDISIGGFCDDYLLDYIVLRSSKLKSFSIWDCYDVSGNLVKVCMERIKNFEHNATENDDDLDDMYTFGSDVDDSFEEDD